MSYNFKAIICWCERHRPDLTAQFEAMIDADLEALLMVAAIGFEAGREFQSKNPSLEADNTPTEPFKGVEF